MDPYAELMTQDIASREAAREEQKEWREIYAMANHPDAQLLTIGHIVFSVDGLQMIPAGKRKQYVLDVLKERPL